VLRGLGNLRRDRHTGEVFVAERPTAQYANAANAEAARRRRRDPNIGTPDRKQAQQVGRDKKYAGHTKWQVTHDLANAELLGADDGEPRSPGRSSFVWVEPERDDDATNVPAFHEYAVIHGRRVTVTTSAEEWAAHRERRRPRRWCGWVGETDFVADLLVMRGNPVIWEARSWTATRPSRAQRETLATLKEEGFADDTCWLASDSWPQAFWYINAFRSGALPEPDPVDARTGELLHPPAWPHTRGDLRYVTPGDFTTPVYVDAVERTLRTWGAPTVTVSHPVEHDDVVLTDEELSTMDVCAGDRTPSNYNKQPPGAPSTFPCVHCGQTVNVENVLKHKCKNGSNVTRQEYNEIKPALDRIEAKVDAMMERFAVTVPNDDDFVKAVDDFLAHAFDEPQELRDAA
jgi:hypothetical protein